MQETYDCYTISYNVNSELYTVINRIREYFNRIKFTHRYLNEEIFSCAGPCIWGGFQNDYIKTLSLLCAYFGIFTRYSEKVFTIDPILEDQTIQVSRGTAFRSKLNHVWWLVRATFKLSEKYKYFEKDVLHMKESYF